jgi:hypothetical protein
VRIPTPWLPHGVFFIDLIKDKYEEANAPSCNRLFHKLWNWSIS